jgi:hypothetical protein
LPIWEGRSWSPHLRELALGGEAAEGGGDGCDGAGEGGGVGVKEKDGASGSGGELGDARAHLPRADHAHRRDLACRRHGFVSAEPTQSKANNTILVTSTFYYRLQTKALFVSAAERLKWKMLKQSAKMKTNFWNIENQVLKKIN